MRWVTQPTSRHSKDGWFRASSLQGEAEGRLKDTWSPGKRQYLCLSQVDSQDKKKRKKKKKAQEPHHRRRFDSVVSSLSPPTFPHCETTSRLWALLNVHSVLTLNSNHFLVKEWNEWKINANYSHADSVTTYYCRAASSLSPTKHHVTCLTVKGGLQ